MAGSERIALWRQTGAWWEMAPQTETERWIDAGGTVREATRQLPPVCDPRILPKRTPHAYTGDDLTVRMRPAKIRDETIGRACGLVHDPSPVAGRRAERSYVPLHVRSGYSFGGSVLLAEEIPRLAAAAGLPSVAIADSFALTGAFELATQCRLHGIKPLIAAAIELEEGGEIVLMARNRTGWRSLSRLISECGLGEPRLFPLANWDRLERHREGLICLTGGDVGPLDRMLVRGQWSEAGELVDRLIGLYGREGVTVEIDRAHLPWSIRAESRLRELAQSRGLRCAAGGAVTHRRRSHFPAQDVLACFKTLCRVDEVTGRKSLRDPSQVQVRQPPFRAFNAERFFKTAPEMQELYADAPELLEETLQIADSVDADVMPKMTQVPPLGPDPHAMLREAVFEGARQWHRRVSWDLRQRLEFELSRISELNYSAYFLTAWDMCRWARSEGILFSGRGSAVDSAVMYCLGISRIDAFRHSLLFDRFLPGDGSKKPDIDIDFEAKRRQDVHAYLIGKYGKDHVAGIAAIGTFRTRGIIREAGKALGMDDEAIGYAAKRLHGGVSPEGLLDALDRRPELRSLGISKERMQWVFKLATVLRDTPRAMGMHSSGVVISTDPLWDTVPVQSCAGGQGGVLDRIIQWDKRSAKRCFIKFDILCLRGQDVLSGTQSRMREEEPDFAVDEIDAEDPEIYTAMRSCQTVGIPQSASPAMTQAHARIRTQNLADASLVQAGIRPGVGGAVKLNQMISRRHGNETYRFTHPDFEPILGDTYGIIVFQEQVDMLLQRFAGLKAGEAEEIREKIHEKRHQSYGDAIRDRLFRLVVDRGYSEADAEQVCEYTAGFKGYGFAQGHALAFAEISARSIWCQQNCPGPYFAALLDAQPAGYYGPATLVNEARIRGLKILPPDVQVSGMNFQTEDAVSDTDPKIRVPRAAVRIDLGSISGVSRRVMEQIVAARPFRSLGDFVHRTRPARDELEQLILAGALDSLHPNRKSMLWGAEAAFAHARLASEPGSLAMPIMEPSLPAVEDFSPIEKALLERSVLGLDIDRHLMAWERERAASKGGLTAAEVRQRPDGARALVVGNPIRLRFPPTPSGKRVVFFDLEDESGLLNVTCFDRVYQKFGAAIVLSQYASVIGRVQIRDGYPVFMAEQVYSYRPVTARMAHGDLNLRVADFLVG